MDGEPHGGFSHAQAPPDLPPSVLAQNRQPTIIAENAAMCVIAIAAVALRFYARKVSKAGFWWDDWVTLMALPYSLVLNIFSAELIRVGQGVHSVYTSAYFKQLYFQFVIYAPSLVFFKVALLLFYVRLFPHHRWLRMSAWILGSAIGVWLIIVECLIIFQCDPIRRTWNRSVPGTCMSRDPIFKAQSIPTIVFDLIILGLAVPLVWGIQLPRTSRIALIGIFMMGGLVTVISIVRLYYALKPVSSDFTWNYVDLSLWSDTESPIGLLSVCLPTYAGLFRRLLVKLGISKPVSSEVSPTNHGHMQIPERPSRLRISIAALEDRESAIWFKEPEPGNERQHGSSESQQKSVILVTKDVKIVDEKPSGRGSSCECLAESPLTPKYKRYIL